jgi:DNA-directed RNA polymerase specialized sigma24 family protein
MTDDASLLRQFAEHGDEAALGVFVRRHLPLVHAAALRRLGGDAALAQDVAQQVFVAAARRAAALAEHACATGWLYTTTRHLAAKAVRREQA